MKTTIFNWAINNRYKLKFLYDLHEIVLEPYLISTNKTGKKVVYGRIGNTKEIKVFEYDKIYNLKVLNMNKFSPIIPILYN
jgi:hypothetical protein